MIEIKHIAMWLAEQIQNKSNCKKRQVACVVFNSEQILAVGVNQHSEDMPCRCVSGVHDANVVHAESNAFAQHYDKSKDTQAVITYAPCIYCATCEITPSGVSAIHVKEAKYYQGIFELKDRGIEVYHQWLTPMQRIQAAHQAKWRLNLGGFL